jgi:hypothetical protein
LLALNPAAQVPGQAAVWFGIPTWPSAPRPCVPIGQGCTVPSPGHQWASGHSASEVHIELPLGDHIPIPHSTQASIPLNEQPGAL